MLKGPSSDTGAGLVLGLVVPTSFSQLELDRTYSKFLENNLSLVTIVTHTSEALSVGVVKKSYDILPKLGGYAIKEGKKKRKKISKASLISTGRLQAEGFLTSCSLICCSVRHTQGFLFRRQLLLTLWGMVSLSGKAQ